jgi:hypothetical protein
MSARSGRPCCSSRFTTREEESSTDLRARDLLPIRGVGGQRRRAPRQHLEHLADDTHQGSRRPRELFVATAWNRSHSRERCTARAGRKARQPVQIAESAPPLATFANFISGIRPIVSATANRSEGPANSSIAQPRVLENLNGLAADRDLQVEGARDRGDRRGLLERRRHLATLDRLTADQAHGAVEDSQPIMMRTSLPGSTGS